MLVTGRNFVASDSCMSLIYALCLLLLLKKYTMNGLLSTDSQAFGG